MAARPAESWVHALPETQNLSRSCLFGYIPVHLPPRFRDWLSPGHARSGLLVLNPCLEVLNSYL